MNLKNYWYYLIFIYGRYDLVIAQKNVPHWLTVCFYNSKNFCCSKCSIINTCGPCLELWLECDGNGLHEEDDGGLERGVRRPELLDHVEYVLQVVPAQQTVI